MTTLVFDLETAKLASEVGGFPNLIAEGGGGVTSLAIVPLDGSRPRLFDDWSLVEGVQLLEEADRVVSFNGRAFDVPILAYRLGRPIELGEHWDLCAMIRRNKGGAHGRWGLGPVSKRTLGRGKEGSGLMAPELARTGRFAELHDYCLSDAYLTRDLYTHVLQYGWVAAPDGSPLHLLPEEDCLVQEAPIEEAQN